jgi:hypothetical protein
MCPRCQYPNIPGAVEWVLKCIAALVAYQYVALLLRLSHRRSNGRAEFAANAFETPWCPG